MNLQKNNSGLVFLEVMIIIAIWSLVFVVMFSALDPIRRVKDVHHSKKIADAGKLQKAINLFIIDNGYLPAGVDKKVRMIGMSDGDCKITFEWNGNTYTSEPECLNLYNPLFDYLSNIPYNPRYGSPGKTRYAIRSLDGKKIEVIPCS